MPEQSATLYPVNTVLWQIAYCDSFSKQLSILYYTVKCLTIVTRRLLCHFSHSPIVSQDPIFTVLHTGLLQTFVLYGKVASGRRLMALLSIFLAFIWVLRLTWSPPPPTALQCTALTRHPFSKACQYHIQTVFQPWKWFMEEPSQFSVGQTAQSLTCSIMEKPLAGLDDCLDMLLSCFRKRMSGLDVLVQAVPGPEGLRAELFLALKLLG